MLKLSRKTEYALLALAELAGVDQLSAREVADGSGVSLPTVRNVLKALCRAGLLESRFGAEGGYRLKREQADISVLDVVEAVEGELAMTPCCGPDGCAGLCELEPTCSIRGPIRQLNEQVLALMRETTLADLRADAPPGVESTPGDVRIMTHHTPVRSITE